MGVVSAYWVSPGVTVVVALLFGLLVGSFLNVVIHRLPRMLEMQWQRQAAELRNEPPAAAEPLNLMVPRSRCPHCGTQIRALHNVPVLSYLALRGRCANCAAPIPLRYPLVELAGGVLAAVAVWHFGLTAAGAGAVLLSFFLVALAFIDLDTQLLPDDMTLPLLWLG
ncbi:MAG TPA: prepilin peptidase, partial [Burkholderiaceae bacterium]|nr:prepilin peptidase [Burkholderiaceae bacterium]